jgi:sugar lactone lactonase YvrE
MHVGESPLWDAGSRRLYWVDIPAGQVFCGDPATGEYIKRSSTDPVGSLAFCRTGGLLVASGQRLEKWPMDLAAPDALSLETMPVQTVLSRFNDGKAGPDGRFWVGSMDPRPDRRATGEINGMGLRQEPCLLAEHLLVPNGIAWSPTGDRMVFSDSGRGAVWSVPFDPVRGPLGEPKPWLDWRADSMGMPDGAAMDEEGCYWSCGIFAGAIHRFDPSGTHLESYLLPISQPTMCCFGGEDLRTLFVTSMTVRLDAKQRSLQPLAGTVIGFRVGVGGAPVGTYG